MKPTDRPTPDQIIPQNDMERLRLAMLQRGIAQQDLADLTGMSESIISLKMNGRRPISAEDREAFAKALDLPVDAIFTDQQDGATEGTP